jgi:hypothetical protein
MDARLVRGSSNEQNEAVTALDVAVRHLPPEFAPHLPTSSNLDSATLMGDAVNAAYLEYRFGDWSQVDYLALFKSRFAAGRWAERVNSASEDSAWERTRAFVRSWREEGDASFAWLEFDGDQPYPRPNPAFGIEKAYFGRHYASREHWDADSALSRTVKGLQILLPGTASAVDTVQRCIARLPTGGSLICVTAMLARSPAVTKLYLRI